MSMYNETIATEGGQDLRAYVARPSAENDNGTALIMMHEVYAVTDGLKSIADRFAAAGFTVACPNMYWRQDSEASFLYEPSAEILEKMSPEQRNVLNTTLAEDRDQAREYMFSILSADDSNEQILDTVNKVSAWLRKEGATAVAATGFCFGARNAYMAIQNDADVEAGVAFYATPRVAEVYDAEKTAKVDKPFMFVVGGQDPYITDNEKSTVMRGSSASTITYIAGRDAPIHERNGRGNKNIVTLYYANNTHGFNRKDSKYSDPGAAEHVQTCAVEFLRNALGVTEDNYGSSVVPRHAELTTPDSPTYHPQPKL